MGITERLITIHENVDSVHEAGYNKGESAGFDAGKQAEYDAFWDAMQNYGNRKDYGKAFLEWNCEYIRPKYKVMPTDRATSVNTFYGNRTLKKIEAEYFDFSQKTRGNSITTGWYWTFSTCSALEEIEDIGMMPDTAYDSTFYGCSSLTKIAKITTDKDVQFGDAFKNCRALQDITFEGEIGNNIDFQWSNQLKKDSITSIINHLSDTASGKTLTLSAAAIATAFGAWSADYDGDGKHDQWIGNDIEEWIELIDSKPNWNIVAV